LIPAAVVAFLAIVGMASGKDALPDFAVADTLQPRDPLSPHPRLLPDGTPLLADVKYATIDGYRPLRLDLYGVGGSGPPRPLVVFLHGGGWYTGTPRSAGAFTNFPAVLSTIANRGYAVAAVEYRLSGEARFPAQLDDVREALRFLAANAARFGIDADRVAVWGASSGANLAALTASDCAAAATPPAAAASPRLQPAPDRTCVDALVGWFGAYRLTGVDGNEAPKSSTLALLGCTDAPCDPQALAAASPYDQVRPGAPPMLLLHGGADVQTPAGQSTRYADRLREAGTAVEVVLLPEVGHGFIGATPAVTLEASQRAVAATLDFLDRTLRRD
jgi:acetyl esterase/lipase